jgi:hypothetical protein
MLSPSCSDFLDISFLENTVVSSQTICTDRAKGMEMERVVIIPITNLLKQSKANLQRSQIESLLSFAQENKNVAKNSNLRCLHRSQSMGMS